MSDPHEADYLDVLITSAGWLWLEHWCDQEWGDAAMGRKYEGIVRSSPDAATMQAQMGQATVARDAVRGILQAPKQRVAQLQALKEKAGAGPIGRRGAGL